MVDAAGNGFSSVENTNLCIFGRCLASCAHEVCLRHPVHRRGPPCRVVHEFHDEWRASRGYRAVRQPWLLYRSLGRQPCKMARRRSQADASTHHHAASSPTAGDRVEPAPDTANTPDANGAKSSYGHSATTPTTAPATAGPAPLHRETWRHAFRHRQPSQNDGCRLTPRQRYLRRPHSPGAGAADSVITVL